MDLPLLKTKFYIPAARAELVPRARLIKQLNAGYTQGHKLLLVSAPAGFGKTTLLSAWIAQNDAAVAWLSLDEDDDDITRFLHYLIGALHNLPNFKSSGGGDAALSMLEAAAPQPPPVKAVLTALINDITVMVSEFILVLDDYHVIQNRAIHDALAFLLDHQPPNMHLAMTTRADPPLPLSRMRARAQLTELRQSDLRFTNDEAVAFLNQVMGLGLSPKNVTALDTLTEGWIVGLQLAALSLQDHADPEAFIATFEAGHHYILEYLIDEVMHQQSETIQQFLMQTSILDRLSGPLCNAVTGMENSDAMLAQLWQRNLFIIPLDSRHDWYRYHHLFKDLLANQLRKTQPPERIKKLHQQASLWFAQHGMIDDAVKHALAAQDFNQAANLIEQNSLAMVTRGELATLLRWINALPRDIAYSRPWLCLHQAWPLTFAGAMTEAEALIKQIELHSPTGSQEPAHQDIRGNIAAMRAMMATMRGELRMAVEWADKADILLPEHMRDQRSIIPFALASAYLFEGALEQSEDEIEKRLDIGQASNNLWTIVRSYCDLADVRMIQGRLRQADVLVQQALQVAEERGARNFPFVGYVLVKQSELLYHRNALDQARDHAQQGIALMEGWQQPFELASGYTMLAKIQQALNDTDAANQVLQRAIALQTRYPHYAKLGVMVDLCRIRLGLVPDIDATIDSIATRFDAGLPSLYREQARLAQSYWLVRQNKGDADRIHALEQLAQDAEHGGRYGHALEAQTILAAMHQLNGDTVLALAVLEKALVQGEPEGIVRVFVGKGAPMAELLQLASDRGITPAYVQDLLSNLETGARHDTPSVPNAPGNTALIEALTERELEVLQLLAQGYTNQQIAEKLFISLNTVKKHTRGIYQKLAVHSRTQAVMRAQELDIL